MTSELYFCPCSRQKDVAFFAALALVDIENVLLGSSVYAVRVMGLISFLLHFNASNLVHEILKNDKIWGNHMH